MKRSPPSPAPAAASVKRSPAPLPTPAQPFTCWSGTRPKAGALPILDAHGRCDVLVNNAGIGHVGTALTTGGEDLDRLWAVNVKGVHYMTRPILASMIARKSGSIIHI